MIRKTTLASALVALLAGCTTPHAPPLHIVAPGETPRKTLGYRSETPANTLIQKFVTAYDESFRLDGEPSAALTFTRYGMTLVDARCDLFFERIGRGAQRGDFIRREFQSLTAALVAALGLTAVGQDAITGVGIGSALGIQTLDNYSTVYFFSPDVSAVQKLVRQTLKLNRAELLAAEASPRSFDDALNALRTYQNICSAHEIKRLVTEAVDPDRPKIGSFGTEAPDLYAGPRDRALAGMSRLLQVDNLDLRQAVLVELLLKRPSGWTEREQDYACSTLAQKVQAVVCAPTPGGIAGQTFVVRTIADPEASRRLAVQWETLRVLVPREYEAITRVQVDELPKIAAEYRSKMIAKAAAGVTQARAKELEDEAKKLREQVVVMTELAKKQAQQAPVAEAPLPAPIPPAAGGT